MKVVIDIPNWLYIAIMEHHEPVYSQSLGDAVRDGTPLPKGHGRLIDENELIDEIVQEEIDGSYYDVIYAHSIYDAETIIEADMREVQSGSCE